jgi:hypothetical protein
MECVDKFYEDPPVSDVRPLFVIRFQVLEGARVKTAAVWNIAPCSIVEVDWCFRDAYCLHYQGDDDRPDDDDDYYYCFKYKSINNVF